MSLDLTEQIVDDFERLRKELESKTQGGPPPEPSVSIKEVELLREQLAESESKMQAARDRAVRLAEQLAESESKMQAARDRAVRLADEVRDLKNRIAELQRRPPEPPPPNRDDLAGLLRLAIQERDDLQDQLNIAKSEIERFVELRYRNQS